MNEEARIYVVVAARVTGTEEVTQPPGRQVAQACHAVSLMRVQRALDMPLPKIKGKVDTTFATEPITTIILQARDDKELGHIGKLLGKEEIPFVWFFDTNDEYGRDKYGELVEIPTALSTFPIEPSAVLGIIDYLPLWGK